MKLDRMFSAMAGFALVASVGFAASARAEEAMEDSAAAGSTYYPYCISNVCEGDYVELYNGGYNGYRGRVVAANDYDYSVTVLLDIGGYLTASVRDVYVLSRQPIPRPQYPRPQACPYGYVYDVYRGCVRYIQPRPIPRPRHRNPRPMPMPRHGYPDHGRGRVETPRQQPPRGGHRDSGRGRGGYEAPRGGGQQRGPGQQQPRGGQGRGDQRGQGRGRS